jgi:plasmid stabilization system protein ParE
VKREVRLSPRAVGDFDRLADFLVAKSHKAARRATNAISLALMSLEQNSERGRNVGGGYRELSIRFGRDGYVARYRIDGPTLVVLRIFHSREQR